MGFFSRIGNTISKAFGGADAELISGGTLARGLITELAPSNSTIEINGGLVERICTMQIQVYLDGQRPYPVTVRQRVQEVLIPQLMSGAAVAVRVDPADPARVAIDFASPPPEVRIAAPSPDDVTSAAWILAHGRPAVAVFVASRPIGMSNHDGVPVHAITLTIVEGEGVAEPYQAEVGNAVPSSALPLAYPGSRVPVRIGVTPQDIVVDWAAGAAG